MGVIYYDIPYFQTEHLLVLPHTGYSGRRFNIYIIPDKKLVTPDETLNEDELTVNGYLILPEKGYGYEIHDVSLFLHELTAKMTEIFREFNIAVFPKIFDEPSSNFSIKLGTRLGVNSTTNSAVKPGEIIYSHSSL